MSLEKQEYEIVWLCVMMFCNIVIIGLGIFSILNGIAPMAFQPLIIVNTACLLFCVYKLLTIDLKK